MAIVNAVFEVLAVAASAIGFIVPWCTTMDEIRQAGSIGERSSIPYVAGLINSALWIVYGFSPDGTWPIVLVNLWGTVWMFRYFVMFLLYCEEGERDRLLVFPVAGAHVLICVVAFYGSNVHNNVLFIRWVCALSRGLVGVVPLLNVVAVCRERDLTRLPSFEFSTIALVNAGLWAGFACTASHFDAFIFWPSLVGIISAGFQVLLHIVLTQIDDIGGLGDPLLAAEA